MNTDLMERIRDKLMTTRVDELSPEQLDVLGHPVQTDVDTAAQVWQTMMAHLECSTSDE